MSTILRTTKFIRRLNICDWKLNTLFYPTNHNVLQTNYLLRFASTAIQSNFVDKNTYKHEIYMDEIFNELKIKYEANITRASRDFENFLIQIENKGSLTQIQALQLLQLCSFFMFMESAETRTNLIDKIWNVINNLGIELNINHFNDLIDAYLVNDIEFLPSAILLEIKKRKLNPNYVTYQKLIEQYCRKGDIENTTKILEIMNKENIPINENVFDSLIKGYAISGNESNALNVINIMKKNELMPTSSSYTEIMCMYAKNGNIEAVLSILNESLGKGIVFMNKHILQIIYTLAFNKHSEYIDKMIPYLVQNYSYNINMLKYINLMIEKHLVNEAFILYKTLAGDNKQHCNNFIRKLVISKADVDTIIKYCNILSENFQENILNATYYSYVYNLHHMGFPLLRTLKQSGGQLKEHYFYPLLVSNKNNLQDMSNILKKITLECNIEPYSSTLVNYVLPFCEENANNTLDFLISSNISVGTASNAIIYFLIKQLKIQEAIDLILRRDVHIRINYMKELVKNLFSRTKEMDSLVKLLSVFSFNKRNNENKNEEFNNLIFDIITHFKPNDIIISDILAKMAEQNVNIKKVTLDKIKDYLKNNLNETLVKNLHKLEAPLTGYYFTLNKVIISTNYNDTEGFKKIIQQIDEKEILPVNYDDLIYYFSYHKDIEESKKWFNKLCEMKSDYKLRVLSQLTYANLLIDNKKTEDLRKLFEYPSVTNGYLSLLLIKTIETFTSKLATYYPDKLQLICYNVWSQIINYPEICEDILKILYETFMNNNNTKGILRTFKWNVTHHNSSFYYRNILKHFITCDDVESLQEIMNDCIVLNGTQISLFTLGMCYFELGKLKEATKILSVKNVINERIIDYTLFESTFMDSNTKFFQFIEIMVKRKNTQKNVYEKLFKICEKNKNVEAIQKLLHNLQKEQKFPELVETYKNRFGEIIPSTNNNESNDTKLDTINENNKNKEIINSVTNQLNELFNCKKHINLYLQGKESKIHFIYKNKIKGNANREEEFFNILIETSNKLIDSDDFLKVAKLFRYVMTDMKFRQKFKFELNKLLYTKNKYSSLLTIFKYLKSDNNKQNDRSRVIDFKFAIEILNESKEFFEDFKNMSHECLREKDADPMSLLWLFQLLKGSSEAETTWRTYLMTEMIPFKKLISLLEHFNATNKFPLFTEKILENTQTSVKYKKELFEKIFDVLQHSDKPNKYEILYDCLLHSLKILNYKDINSNVITLLTQNLTDKTKIETLNEAKNGKLQLAAI